MAQLVLAVVALACGAPTASPTPSSSPSPAPTGALLTVTARGGLCPVGACELSIFVERDGSVHQAAKPPNDIGQVPADALAALEAAIDSTDFDALRSHPFTGTCPTAYDGQELLFDFGTTTAMERVASCQVEIDWNSPLFVAVAIAVGQYISLPTFIG